MTPYSIICATQVAQCNQWLQATLLSGPNNITEPVKVRKHFYNAGNPLSSTVFATFSYSASDFQPCSCCLAHYRMKLRIYRFAAIEFTLILHAVAQSLAFERISSRNSRSRALQCQTHLEAVAMEGDGATFVVTVDAAKRVEVDEVTMEVAVAVIAVVFEAIEVEEGVVVEAGMAGLLEEDSKAFKCSCKTSRTLNVTAY
jgi:hypothetical protein